MARIRSIHPGLWTDEAFMSLSAHGRLLLMGIWTEAFDDGVFEWKPLTLKARIFPVDDVDVTNLLDQLLDFGVIGRDETHPKKPGLIRNFQKFQRPKKPNNSGMLSDEWRTFVGWKEEGSEPVPNQGGTDTEKSPQMEDGGGVSKTVASATDAASPVDARKVLWTDGLATLIMIAGKTEPTAKGLIGKWLRDTKDDCALVLSKIHSAHIQRIGEPVSWISAALKPPDKPPKPLTQGESLRNMAREKGIIDATGTPIRRLETSDRDGENPGVGDTLRLTVAGNHGW